MFFKTIFLPALNHWSSSLCHSLVPHTIVDLQPSNFNSFYFFATEIKIGTAINFYNEYQTFSAKFATYEPATVIS